jgi:hypothetical protein
MPIVLPSLCFFVLFFSSPSNQLPPPVVEQDYARRPELKATDMPHNLSLPLITHTNCCCHRLDLIICRRHRLDMTICRSYRLHTNCRGHRLGMTNHRKEKENGALCTGSTDASLVCRGQSRRMLLSMENGALCTGSTDASLVPGTKQTHVIVHVIQHCSFPAKQ